MDALTKNYEYFKENFDELYAKYKNMYIVIKDCTVIASYGSFSEAVDETLKTEKAGTFSVKHCIYDEIVGYNFYNNNISFKAACL